MHRLQLQYRDIISYQWQSSTDNINFTNIASATAATYNSPSITEQHTSVVLQFMDPQEVAVVQPAIPLR